jgi:hypothetical protein
MSLDEEYCNHCGLHGTRCDCAFCAICGEWIADDGGGGFVEPDFMVCNAEKCKRIHMKRRLKRYREWVKFYDPDDGCEIDDEPLRYLQAPRPRPGPWIQTFDDMKSAPIFHGSARPEAFQESGYFPTVLIDLDTGDEYDPNVSYTFTLRPPPEPAAAKAKAKGA